MSVTENRKSAEQIGTLSSCLIDGDSEQKARERRIKRRALVISIVLQSAALLALVLVPLLGHTERVTYKIVTPMPPYRSVANQPVGDKTSPPPVIRRRCFVCYDPPAAPHPVGAAPQTFDRPTEGNGEILITDGSDTTLPSALSSLLGKRGGPTPPEDPNSDQKKRIVRGGDVQQAFLTRRVEPAYPQLMRQIRRSGKVELRAIVSTEGTIESLQIISGDPGFYASALDAVRQWQYKPTYLNGKPVEVETIITVVYTLNP